MAVNSVDVTEIDGALGILPNGGKAVAVLGVATDGPKATPAAFGQDTALIGVFTRGPAAQLGAQILQKSGKPVLMCRTEQSVAGSFLDAVAPVAGSVGAITKTGTGTSVFTNDGASVPAIEASIVVLFPVGGTRGVTGIIYQISFNGGSTFGTVHALGTDTSFAIGGGSGVTIDVGAGTVVAGDFISFPIHAPILASAGELVLTGEGTSDVTIDGGASCDDDYQAFVEIVEGGIVGTDAIVLRWALDDGRTPSADYLLGTADHFIFPDSGGVRINFAAGTLPTGMTIAFPTVAPCWNNTDLLNAAKALKNSAIDWEIVIVTGPLTPSAVGVLDTVFADRKHAWIGSVRTPVGDETDADYTTSLLASFSSTASTYGELCAADCEQLSAIDGRQYRRPAVFPIGGAEASATPEEDIARLNRGALPGCNIRDTAGNPKYHDEFITPGLSDAGFSVLRTWDPDIARGVYPNNPYLFSSPGSDFDIMPKRRVMNIAHRAFKLYMSHRLAEKVFVDKKTGFITEADAREIQNGAQAAIATATKGMVSAVTVVVNRTDNLLSGAPITGSYRLVSLAYPGKAEFSAGFENPALNVQAV